MPSLTWLRAHPNVATSANDLSYGGGVSGVGVTTGTPRYYIVFYGTQWGSETLSGNNETFSNDPAGMAPYVQNFFRGLGTGSETWSGVMTQYCEGVATGSQTCPAQSAHTGYPTGGALGGVWYDNAAAEPATATGHQIGLVAVAAAAHFGNTTAASNRSVAYDVISATGLNPDNYQSQGFCAWHDYTGDSTLSGGGVTSPYGPIAFTNMPYVPDAGASCGQNFVNAGTAGTNDGVSIVDGHEWAETITDQFPAGGWTDSGGAENGDKCAWIASGQGASQNISLTTGNFAVQSTWANDFNGGNGGCEVSHATVGGGNTVTVTNPGSQTSTVGTAVSLQLSATDSQSGQSFTWTASGLPAGLSISTGGLISGTPTTAGTPSVTVTARDTTQASGSATFTWTVNPQAGNTITVANPGSQTSTVGTAVSLQMSATDSQGGQTLTWGASGLPAGLTITSSGLISGTPTTAVTASVTVTATDGTGAHGSATFTWTVNPQAGNTITVSNPGSQTSTVGTAVSLQMSATDSQSGQTLTWGASGLPAGLSINSSGLISGTPTTAGTSSVTVTAKDTTQATGSASFSWTVNPSGGGGIVNGGFETGSLSGWTASGSAAVTTSGPHSGTYAAMLGLTTPTNGDSTIAQTFSAPANGGTLTFWYNITCPDTVTYDWATATLKDNTTGVSTTPLAKTCVSSSGWKQVNSTLTGGQSYTLTLVSHDDNYSGDPTYTKYDDVSIGAGPPPPPSGITNGGFETGSLSGWTPSASAAVTTTGAHSGTYAAMLGLTTPTNGDSTVTQTFVAPTGSSAVHVWYDNVCPDTVTYDWATVALRNNTTGTTATLLGKTCVSNSGWVQVSGSVIAGDSYTLTLLSHDDNYAADPTYTKYDDVSTS